MNIDAILEFDKVKEKWMALALTEDAKARIAKAACFYDEAALEKELRDTSDARRFLEVCRMPPLASLEGSREMLDCARKEGCLTPYQLEQVGEMLAAVGRMKQYLERGKQYENPLAYYEINLDPACELREEIARQIRGGAVEDQASRQLLRLRREMDCLKEQMKRKAEQIIRANKESVAEAFSTIRNGRICIPVKRECKWKLPGSVIAQSSTGSTVFIHPAAIESLYEELQQVMIQEENEVYQILCVLTAMVLEQEAAMEENIRVMEKLDFIFSKGKLSLEMDGTEPRMNVERVICLKGARHPLMEKRLCVPLDFTAGREIRGVVITGPNTGGKTVAIKTVALNCLMAQCGLHVTCEEACICMNSGFLCDIGDGQAISENLSTFSAHMKHVLEILETADKDSLVLMDELGSGTDPAEGMGIAVSILEELERRGCLFFVTTHYPEVKEYAHKTAHMVNARMEFDRETLQPTYRMIMGEAGESCAFYIARKLGMPEGMLRTAVRAAYGEGAAEEYFSGVALVSAQKGFVSQGGAKLPRIQKRKKFKPAAGLAQAYHVGDSVMVFPEKRIGIVCLPVNEKGVLRVQLPGKKIWINHKRVKLHVKAAELYPEDYDFSIVFDTVENRKIRHDMERKYTEEVIREEGAVHSISIDPGLPGKSE